jgi:hypothetical protein
MNAGAAIQRIAFSLSPLLPGPMLLPSLACA